MPPHNKELPPKTFSGIPGLDEVLLGGVPAGQTTLVRGGPGTGKTVLSMEFIYRGALGGEPGIFVTFEERDHIIRQNAKALGWDLEALERAGLLSIVQPELPDRLMASGDFDITGLLAVLEGSAREIGAKRIVIDAVDVVLRLFRDAHEQESQLFRLHHWIWQQSPTAMLTLKASRELSAVHERMEYMADCVMQLDNRVSNQVTTRRLRIVKYRGSGFSSNEFPCLITEHGFALMPISRAKLTRAVRGKVSTGIKRLDDYLDGGFGRGTCVLIGGVTGTGKTTMATEFIVAACRNDEKVLFINFEESVESLINSMRSPGFDLESTLQSGRLNVAASMPESRGAEEHLWRLFEVIDEFKPDHLVVDAISACVRMGSEHVAFDFLVRLLTHCRSDGITCIYLNQTDPSTNPHSLSGVGISSLVDALIVLEQDWPEGSHRRRLLIVKSRGSRHSHLYHDFQITDSGIEIAAGRNGNGDSGNLPGLKEQS